MSVETIDYKGYSIAIEYDDQPESPAEWGNYSIHEIDNGFEPDADLLAKLKDGRAFMIDKLEHGNVIYRLASDGSDWDKSRNWGYIEFTDEYATNFDDMDGRRKMAEQDLETYTDWANGNVYGYQITNLYGDDMEDGSLWGIYGLEYAIEEAKMAVDADIKYDRPSMHAKTAGELHR